MRLTCVRQRQPSRAAAQEPNLGGPGAWSLPEHASSAFVSTTTAMPWVADEAKADGGDKARCMLNQLVDSTDRRENTVVLDFCSCRLICFNCFSNMKLGNSTVSGQPSNQSIQGDVAVEILRASRPRDRTGTGASIEIRIRWGQEPRCPARFTLLEEDEITWNRKPPSQVDNESAIAVGKRKNHGLE